MWDAWEPEATPICCPPQLGSCCTRASQFSVLRTKQSQGDLLGAGMGLMPQPRVSLSGHLLPLLDTLEQAEGEAVPSSC